MANPDKPHPESPALSAETGQKGGFPWKVIVAIVVIAIIGVIFWRRHQAESAGKQAAGAKGASFPVPVIIGKVEQKDIPIYLDGIGTVQAFNTVTVRSRVDGQLLKLGFNEGQDLHPGDLVAQIDPNPFRTQVEQAEAKKAQDEAQLANADVELKRNGKLLAEKIVSQEVYDAQKAQTLQLTAAVKADQAAIDTAKVQLAYTTIAAPISGRAGIRQVDVGNIIRASDTNGIVILTQLKPVMVMFTLPEQTLRNIQRHSASDMKVLAVERDNRTILDEGKLTVVDNQIDPTTGTIRLKATFPNDKLLLWPGQFVNTRLLLSVRTNATVVPASVVQRGPEGAYAFIVKEDSSTEMRPVKVAFIEQDQAVIDEGLKPGENVVVDGQYKLQAGSKVKPAGGGKEGAPDGTQTGAASKGASEHSGKKSHGQKQ